ncbi:helix-turn-helix transcriptional regulator [Streptomyces erythrochromogenes]|uniref:helix-turn-helix transcriptional regulator n=1 Tax=Streptomyces erythrochromogenes TaxID=285574 RepID=UPI00331FA739
MAACRNGHPLTAATTYRSPTDPTPRCQQCRREAVARYKARRRGKPAPAVDFERHLLRLAANGATDQEIADRTGATLGKVTWTWRRLKGELGGRDRTHTVILAIRSRRISLADVPDRQPQQAREGPSVPA